MIVHGMIDENVHFRHSARLVTALGAAGKDHTLLPFPRERHMPRGTADRMYMERAIFQFFRAALKLGPEPPEHHPPVSPPQPPPLPP